MTRIVLIEGWASIYNTPDLNGDVIAPGAFAASLKSSGHASVKLLYQHTVENPIGRWRRFEEREAGLYAYGEIVLATQAAQEAYELVRAQILDGLSIGYRTQKSAKRPGGRLITAASLWEVSLVTFPMAPRARLMRFQPPIDEADHPETRVFAEAVRQAAHILSA